MNRPRGAGSIDAVCAPVVDFLVCERTSPPLHFPAVLCPYKKTSTAVFPADPRSRRGVGTLRPRRLLHTRAGWASEQHVLNLAIPHHSAFFSCSASVGPLAVLK